MPKSQLILVANVGIVIHYATLSAAQGDFCSKLRTTSSVAFHLSRMVEHKTTITIITRATRGARMDGGSGKSESVTGH